LCVAPVHLRSYLIHNTALVYVRVFVCVCCTCQWHVCVTCMTVVDPQFTAQFGAMGERVCGVCVRMRDVHPRIWQICVCKHVWRGQSPRLRHSNVSVFSLSRPCMAVNSSGWVCLCPCRGQISAPVCVCVWNIHGFSTPCVCVCILCARALRLQKKECMS